MNSDLESANAAAESSQWLRAVSTFTFWGLILDVIAFWVVLTLALFGVVPWVTLAHVLGIAIGIMIFAFLASSLLGFLRGLNG